MSEATQKAIPVIEDIIRDRDEWKRQHENLLAMYHQSETDRIALVAALKPFAHAAFEADGYPDNEAFTLVLRPDGEEGLASHDMEPASLITAGQLRRARQALASMGRKGA